MIQEKKWDLKIFIKKNNMYLIFVILLVACIFLSEDFLTVNNIINIGRQQAGLIIISMGLLYVIETGGIDLGSGAIMALSSVMVTFCLTTHEIGMFAAIVIPLLLGGLIWSYFRNFCFMDEYGSFYCHIGNTNYGEGFSLCNFKWKSCYGLQLELLNIWEQELF